MVEVDNNAYNSTLEHLSGWLCSEEEILPSIQRGILITSGATEQHGLTDIEDVITDVYFLFLNGDI